MREKSRIDSGSDEVLYGSINVMAHKVCPGSTLSANSALFKSPEGMVEHQRFLMKVPLLRYLLSIGWLAIKVLLSAQLGEKSPA